MGRWEPDSRQRLEEAALALFGEQGFDNTSVAQIAERAGLTERTFFRHFTDKREVLFSGAKALQDLFVSAVANAPQGATPSRRWARRWPRPVPSSNSGASSRGSGRASFWPASNCRSAN